MEKTYFYLRNIGSDVTGPSWSFMHGIRDVNLWRAQWNVCFSVEWGPVSCSDHTVQVAKEQRGNACVQAYMSSMESQKLLWSHRCPPPFMPSSIMTAQRSCLVLHSLSQHLCWADTFLVTWSCRSWSDIKTKTIRNTSACCVLSLPLTHKSQVIHLWTICMTTFFFFLAGFLCLL